MQCPADPPESDDVLLFERARLVDPGRVTLIPGAGVDCRRFRPGLGRESGADSRVLLAARLLWDKGLAEYTDAARRLHAEGRDIAFLLAGVPDPGNPAAVPEATLRAWVDERLLEWLGHVDDMPASAAYGQAVVFPSYREGFPTVSPKLLPAVCLWSPPTCRAAAR